MKTYRIQAISKKGTTYRFRLTISQQRNIRTVLNAVFPEGLMRLFHVEELKVGA